MYVCNCNGLRRQDVEAAIAAGAERPRDVHAHHGCAPACARCLPEIGACIRARAAVCGDGGQDAPFARAAEA